MELVTDNSPPSWPAYALPAALAMALGWGVRGQYGGEKGAALAGALLALALVLVTRDPAKRRRAPWVLLAGLGFAFGGMMSYGEMMGYVANPEKGVRFATDWAFLQEPLGVRLWGLMGMAIVAGIWGWLGGTFLGVSISDRTYRGRDLAAIAAAAALCGLLGHLLLIKWAHIITSTRSDFWATLLGITAAFFAYVALVKRDRAARILGLCGLLGFGLAFPLLDFINATLSPRFPLRWYDWWKIVEQGLGFFGGGAIAIGLFLLDRSGHRAAPPRPRPRLERLAIAFAVWLVVAWNGHNNFDYWANERHILSTKWITVWLVAASLAAALLLAWTIAAGARPIAHRAIVAAYLILVWFAVIGAGLKMALPYSGIGWVTVQIGFTAMAAALTAHALLAPPPQKRVTS